jgi:hypothetical protein
MTYAPALIAFHAIGISGCTVAPPPVDLTGVDMGAYSRDQIACDAVMKQNVRYMDDFKSDCMTCKGYKIYRIDRMPRGTGV